MANFCNRFTHIDILEEATNCSIDQFLFYNNEDANKKIKQLEGKYDVLIGGGYTTSIASKYGLKSIMIESSTESIEYAIDIACNMAKSIRQEQQKLKEMSNIINQSSEGIIAIDKNYNLTVFNPKAQKIFDVTFDKAHEKRNHILKTTGLLNAASSGQSINDKIIKIKGQDVIINVTPTKVNNDIYGGVCTLQEVSIVQQKEQNIRISLHKKGLFAKIHFRDIIGKSKAITEAILKAKKYAKTDFTVLITGETGTGKELFAQSIHNYSKRKNGPFVAINCAAIPENLLEAELFGYEEGSFTGAKRGGKTGLFELAHNGTIFLDEIGDIPLVLQARLLRALQEKEIIRVGGNKVIPINVRIIASTNVNLHDKVLHNNFREDLYYRLSVLNLHLCPLRERLEDIPLLAYNMLEKYNVTQENIVKIISALNNFKDYEWRGNIRELENILAKLTVITENYDSEVTCDLITNELRNTFYHYHENSAKNTSKTQDLPGFSKQFEENEKDILTQLSHQQNRLDP